MRRIFLFVLLTATVSLSYAQDIDQEAILIQADDEFNAGRYYGLPALLKPVLESSKTTREQKVRAYLLLTQAYLILDDPIAADDSYLKLLKEDPEYVANPQRDPIDVYYLSKKFTATPIFTPHGRLGFNTSFVRIIDDFNTSGRPVNTTNLLRLGVQGGVGIDWNINNNWSLCGEANYSFKAFAQRKEFYFDNDDGLYPERQNWMDFPIYVKYAFDSGKIRPFGYAGFAINMLITARGPNWLYTNNFSDGSKAEADGATEDLIYKRNKLNYSIVVGGGAKYKIGKDFLYVDLRYMAGLSNLTNLSTIYYESDGSFDGANSFYNNVGDLFRLDNLSISAGYIRPIYDPRRKSKPRVFKLFRKKQEPNQNPE